MIYPDKIVEFQVKRAVYIKIFHPGPRQEISLDRKSLPIMSINFHVPGHKSRFYCYFGALA